jgi:NTE family protein
MQVQPDPPSDWARHGLRINDIIDNQVRSLRARQVIGAFEAGVRAGTYWGIRTRITDYDVANALPCPEAQTAALAETPTRLKRLDTVLQERLINWGYAVCDAAMRKHVAVSAAPPAGFPYPAAKVGS